MRRRTKGFASQVVRFYMGLDKSRQELRVLGHQLLRSGTSVAANYREASRARSDAEFIAKIELCTQEADESQLWLELLQDDCGIPQQTVQPIWQEADELIAIFTTMSKNTKKRKANPLRPLFLFSSGFRSQSSSLIPHRRAAAQLQLKLPQSG